MMLRATCVLACKPAALCSAAPQPWYLMHFNAAVMHHAPDCNAHGSRATRTLSCCHGNSQTHGEALSARLLSHQSELSSKPQAHESELIYHNNAHVAWCCSLASASTLRAHAPALASRARFRQDSPNTRNARHIQPPSKWCRARYVPRISSRPALPHLNTHLNHHCVHACGFGMGMGCRPHAHANMALLLHSLAPPSAPAPGRPQQAACPDARPQSQNASCPPRLNEFAPHLAIAAALHPCWFIFRRAFTAIVHTRQCSHPHKLCCHQRPLATLHLSLFTKNIPAHFWQTKTQTQREKGADHASKTAN